MFSFVTGFFGGTTEKKEAIGIKPVDPFIPSVSSWEKKDQDSLFKPLPKLKNVGKFESLPERSNEIFECENLAFTGVQLNLQNVLHKKFTTIHTIALGKKENNIDPWSDQKDEERSLYSFSSSLSAGHWYLNGRWNNNGITRAVVQYESGALSLNASGQFSEDDRKTAWETDGAITKNDWCAQLKLQGPAIGLSYTQPFYPRYSMGSEFFFSPLNSASRLKWIGKYDNDDGSVATASYCTGLGPDQFALNYTKEVKKNLDVSAGLDFSYEKKNWTSVFKMGYFLRNGYTQLRGMMDSTLKAVCIMEEPLNEVMMLQACLKFDYQKNVYDFGIGAGVTM